MAPPVFCLAPRLAPPVFFLISRLSSFGWHIQGCQMRSVKILAILSTAPDLSFVVIRKQHRENGDNQCCWATINNLPYFGWFVTFRCVCDVMIAPRIASTAADKLPWRNYPDKIHYKSHYLWFEKFCVSSFWSYGKLLYFHNTSFRHRYSKYRPLLN